MHTLTLTERFDAPVERVFGAWASSAQIQRWFGPGKVRVQAADVDFRLGGRYRIAMRDTDGAEHVAIGEYREIVPNRRLAFTWQWEGSDAVTFVELEFHALGAGGSELKLVHTRFATEEQRDHHGQGWRGCFAQLRGHVADGVSEAVGPAAGESRETRSTAAG
ncbi:MAG TPA: SRPBCC domain-containing protein [Gammaproteobacteria bacterium]|nr:SRPBCC domain-containing protein [Gammaproteobacteria bacterium]